MEFTEIGKELGGLNAQQVYELAKFSKDVLSKTGILFLQSEIMNIIKDILNSGDFPIEKNRYAIACLLHIASAANTITEDCWDAKKTPLGMTGVSFDNEQYGLYEATDIKLT